MTLHLNVSRSCSDNSIDGPENAPEAPQTGRGKMTRRVLVVEDDPQVREVVSLVLEDAGYEVQSAANGLDALKWLAGNECDLVLTDVWMPQMNGLELLAELRRRNSPPRAVVMTADGTPETLLRAVRAAAFQFVRKPFQPRDLLAALEKAFEASPVMPAIEVVSASPDWVELVAPCTLEAAEVIQSFLLHLKTDLSSEVRDSVAKVFRELLLNAMEWGGNLDPDRKVRIAYLRTPRLLLYRIADPGSGFNQEDLPHCALQNPPGHPVDHLAERERRGLRPGGFGLLMARQLVDELVYNEAHNEVVFIKYLDHKEGG